MKGGGGVRGPKTWFVLTWKRFSDCPSNRFNYNWQQLWVSLTKGSALGSHWGPISTPKVPAASAPTGVTTLFSQFSHQQVLKFKYPPTFPYLIGTLVLVWVKWIEKFVCWYSLSVCFIFSVHYHFKSRYMDARWRVNFWNVTNCPTRGHPEGKHKYEAKMWWASISLA